MNTSKRMRRDRSRKGREQGFSLLELLIVVSIMLIIAAIALPSLLKARAAGHEGSAAQTVRTLMSAQANFKTLSGTYATDLKPLKTANIIDQSWADASPSTRQGYKYSVASADANSFTITAEPVDANAGHRAFCVSEKAVVYFDGGTGIDGTTTQGTAANCLASITAGTAAQVLGVND